MQDLLKLTELKNKINVQPCSAKTTEGVWEGMSHLGDIFDANRGIISQSTTGTAND